jgi:hypothetical protein
MIKNNIFLNFYDNPLQATNTEDVMTNLECSPLNSPRDPFHEEMDDIPSIEKASTGESTIIPQLKFQTNNSTDDETIILYNIGELTPSKTEIEEDFLLLTHPICNNNFPVFNPINNTPITEETKKKSPFFISQKVKRNVNNNEQKIKIIIKEDESTGVNNGTKEEGNKANSSNKIHTKFTSDNLMKKTKTQFLNDIIPFFNENIKKNCDQKEEKDLILLKINSEIKSNPNKKDKKFINEPIKNLLSSKIANRYKNYDSNHNQLVIQKLAGLEKFAVINDILNMTFLELFKIYRGEELPPDKDDCLKELNKKYNEFLKKYEKSSKEKSAIQNAANGFEEYYELI